MKNVNKVSMFDKIIIFMLVGIIPFIVYGTNYNMPQSPTEYSVMFDYFNFLKVMLIKITAFAILFNSVAELLINEKSRKKISFKSIDKKLIFIGLIVLATLIAYIFSDYKYIATFGAFERFESIWVHFSYAIIFVYSLQFFKKEGAFDIFSYAILLSTFVVGGIGTLQFLGVDVFSSSLLKALTYKSFDIQIVSPGSFTTMYNINTSASYSVLMMVVLLIIIILNENKIVKAVGAFNFVLVAVTFYNSMSEASYIAAAVGVVSFVVVYLASFIVKGNKGRIIGFGAFVCVVVVGGVILLATTELTTKVLDKITPTITFVRAEQNSNELTLYNKNDDYLKFVTLDGSYEIYENESLITAKNYGDTAADVYDTTSFGQLTITATVLNDVTEAIEAIQVNDLFVLSLKETEPLIYDIKTSETNVFAEYTGFDKYPNALTNRGYIWSRSIPILKDKFLTGIGSDVYFKVFPNNDNLVQSFMGVSEVTVDKPHSIYLNMAINNGILYLLGFLGVVCLTIYESFANLFKKESTSSKRLALSIYLAGIVAYLVNGLATDNLVIIVMLFWVYLGLSVSLSNDVTKNVVNAGKANKKNTKKAVTNVKATKDNKDKTEKLNTKSEQIVDTEKENKVVEEIKEVSENKIDYSEIGVSYHDLMNNQSDDSDL